jgi:hypothetical protein
MRNNPARTSVPRSNTVELGEVPEFELPGTGGLTTASVIPTDGVDELSLTVILTAEPEQLLRIMLSETRM